MKKGLLTVLGTVLGAVAGGAAIGNIEGRKMKSQEKEIEKYRAYYNMLNQWMVLKQEGKSLEKYFIDNGYKTVAIYGMGEMGNRLYEELKGSSIEVKYAVDQNASSTYSELEVVEKESKLEEADVMVVTAIYAFDAIEEEMGAIVDFPVVSLEDVVYEV